MIQFEPLKNNACPKCGETVCYVRIKCADGTTRYKAECVECDFGEGVPTLKNARKRNNSTLNHWAIRVKARDHNTCRVCGKVSDDNEAHHIIPVANTPSDAPLFQYKANENNGVTLCKECHTLAHGGLRCHLK